MSSDRVEEMQSPYGQELPPYLTRKALPPIKKSLKERIADALGCGNDPRAPGRRKRGGGGKRKRTKRRKTKRRRTKRTKRRKRPKTKRRKRTSRS